MAKHLIHLAFSSWILDNMVMYDTAVNLAKRGEEVHLFYCDGVPSVCFANPCQSKMICGWCRWYRKKMRSDLPANVKVHVFSDYYKESFREVVNSISFDYSTMAEIQNLKYKNVLIGFGALSTYISQTRNLNPLVDAEFKRFFDSYLSAQCLLVEILDSALNEIKPDYVALYNGRFAETRPIYDYSKKLGYTVRCYENVYPLGLEHGISTIFFEDCLPHNIQFTTEMVEKNWQDSPLSENEKERIGKSFFENRRGGKRAGDTVYALRQKAGCLPDNWDNKKRNVVIFNSSEDEYASIGDEYAGVDLFTNQAEGIKNILEMFKDDKDFYFYLRIHPNLKGIKYGYHKNLYNLEKQYNNIKVIPPESLVSSYTLLDHTEKSIVFGSTIGVEVAYWGKPVILLAETFYSYLGFCYVPRSLPELKSLIVNELKKLDNIPALKYGFFIMKDIRGEPITNFDTRATVIKNKYFFFKYKPIKFSTVYLAFIKIFLIILGKLSLVNKIPTKENKQINK